MVVWKMLRLRRVFCGLVALSVVFYVIVFTRQIPSSRPELLEKATVVFSSPEDFEGFDNVSGAADGRYIVPNYVHFLRLGQPHFSFVDTVCVLAALKNQSPDRLYIHTDVTSFAGKYWDVLVGEPLFKEKVVFKYVQVPAGIFGQPLSRRWRRFHGGDLLRLRILMEYGGIFLDNDSYLVRSLNDLRRYEMTLGWRHGGNISNQAIVAHKNARFLGLWLDSYREYRANSWYYNAGIRPTQEILVKRPGMVHRMKRLLAEVGLMRKLFMENWSGWRDHYVIHLLARHQYLLKNVTGVATYPVVFNEINIKNYSVTFRDMVYDVYPVGRE